MNTNQPVSKILLLENDTTRAEALEAFGAAHQLVCVPVRRDALAAALKSEGIPTAIYYAKPLHRQEAYRPFPVADGGTPVTERLCDEVISLPMHAYLEPPVQDRIIDAVRRALA